MKLCKKAVRCNVQWHTGYQRLHFRKAHGISVGCAGNWDLCIKVGRAEEHALEMKAHRERNSPFVNVHVFAPRVCPGGKHCCHITSGLTQRCCWCQILHLGWGSPDCVFCTAGWILEKGSSARGWLGTGNRLTGKWSQNQTCSRSSRAQAVFPVKWWGVESGAGLDDPHGSLPTQDILWFCEMNPAALPCSWNGCWTLSGGCGCTRRSRKCFIPSSALLHTKPTYWSSRVLPCHFRSACGGFLCHFHRGSEEWPCNSLFPSLTFKNDLTLFLFLCTSLSKGRCVSHLWCIT